MLASLRTAAGTIGSQCRPICFSSYLLYPAAPHIRTFVTTAARKTTVVNPAWVKTSTESDRRQWNYLLDTSNRHLKKEEPSKSPEDIWKMREKNEVAYLPRPNNPYSGRSVPVIKGQVSVALNKLKGILSINAVRQTNIRDERHEKKGEKRNRLRSLRWRRRFAHEVRKKVQLVNEIRARGA
ncbi:hypothetical protein PYCCODRAFT_1436218 [Trametes coccinea BRFM310]|uniref:Ribosomal protein S21 n=1 Tax=Trametes coccinea (strain BRFM310) TaxID=1353009 RepID=A0A1Y2IMX8_TRAC3|nr:hypothetical protein PYCCODRAFT_1436218 [Trametes coccinea BRFM310]